MTGMLSKSKQEQVEVLGIELAATDQPKIIMGVLAWRSLWSMGKGAGASAFMRSPASLAQRGHHVHLLQPCAPGEQGVDHYAGITFHKYSAPKVFSNPDRSVIPRLFERIWRYLFYQLHAPRYAMKLAREINPDVIIAYGIMVTPVARWIANKLRLPFGGRYYGNTISLALNNRVRWWCNFMEWIGFRITHDAMILTNDGSPALEVLRRLKVDFTPVHYLRNGIPEDLFLPGPKPDHLKQKLGLPDDAFVLMTVTRLAPEKKLERTLRALAEIRREIPHAVVILLGNGPEQPALERMAQELGISEAVFFPGPIPNNDLADWYRLSDIVVSLLDRTNASNPVFEAMACERCVLALDVGTTSETVRHNETGILVQPDKLADIPEILISLYRDPARRQAIGKQARPFVLDHCGTVERRMMREIEVIEALIQKREVIPGNLVE